MGKLIHDGVVYGGSSAASAVVTYDNSQSDLKSKNVQDAITELDKALLSCRLEGTVLYITDSRTAE